MITQLNEHNLESQGSILLIGVFKEKGTKGSNDDLVIEESNRQKEKKNVYNICLYGSDLYIYMKQHTPHLTSYHMVNFTAYPILQKGINQSPPYKRATFHKGKVVRGKSQYSIITNGSSN